MEPRSGNTQQGSSGARARHSPLEKPPSRRLRVLIVEDQPFVALDCQDALTARGHDVVDTASTARSATALAKRHRPDLILMDIRLSGSRTGLEAAIEIYRKLGIRCVFASAYADDFTRRLVEPAHPLGWLHKPFSSEEMIEVVEEAAENR